MSKDFFTRKHLKSDETSQEKAVKNSQLFLYKDIKENGTLRNHGVTYLASSAERKLINSILDLSFIEEFKIIQKLGASKMKSYVSIPKEFVGGPEEYFVKWFEIFKFELYWVLL